MRSQDLKRAKREVRRRVLAVRDALSADELAAEASAVAERCLALPEVERAHTVLVFWSFGSELPTAPLIAALDAREVTVGLPVIADGDLQARAYRPGDPTTVTTFGAREPSGGRFLDPEEIDVVLVPAVAFDRTGRRIGYGGGYYDRFLPRTRPDTVRVGICASVQLVEEVLPAGSFDLRVDAIVTPGEVVRCAR